jgi:hypothetical protein
MSRAVSVDAVDSAEDAVALVDAVDTADPARMARMPPVLRAAAVDSRDVEAAVDSPRAEDAEAARPVLSK